MRYLGNKETIVSNIIELLKDKNIIKNEYSFFDAFCGTGSVADALKSNYSEIVINDNLKWSTLYSSGRLLSGECGFNKLNFNPFDFINNTSEIKKGFFYKNYSPGGSERMYFSAQNAGRIDYIRENIENWFLNGQINKSEYNYLLASLIESVSKVSNTAGVYGAYLKHWDSRALKEIEYLPVDCSDGNCNKLTVFNEKIEDIIENVECDILYLDPPYTQNQYGTQYHLLETLILNDSPDISKVTGSRSTTPMRSDWSKDFKCHILLDKIISKTKASHILLSYSADGFMSKDFIDSVMMRYGVKSSYECRKIAYKKYKNHKSKGESEHFEYLFYIKKREKNTVRYESPLNYIGSKSKYIDFINSALPNKIDKFYDIFGGGFNVGINIDADSVIYNEYNFFVKELIESIHDIDTYKYITNVKKLIKKYNLEPENKDNYLKARKDYNSSSIDKRDPILLYTIILYGFQQQIRFNGSYEFNNPTGMRWFNNKVLEKLISFSRKIKEINVSFYQEDYKLLMNSIDSDDFVYLDPPYRLTTGSYNDGKRGFNGWGVDDESNLFCFCNQLNNKKIKFMLSYVLEHGGEYNHQLKSFIEENDYKLIELPIVLGRNRKEVIIVNYEK
ncbi:DNA adenine methylase [Erwinia amylovora]|uniref:DNA adenine methylase n=1 Tax=Erwinia amylovora TaxID=552 RepID=UPI00144467E4|nr:DNA adenine methylase [Erwinia amylovora]